jgi:hypothetical protein
MIDIPGLLAKIPDNLKPMAALGIGALMLVLSCLSMAQVSTLCLYGGSAGSAAFARSGLTFS